jgi:catechol 2,3-dioxygenase-like lactoylglutathione lyase family enzyme
MGQVPQRVSLVTLGARNLPALRAFYKRLGWEESATSSDDYAVFTTAGVLLSLFPLQRLAEDAGLEVPPPGPCEFRGVTFAINVEHPEQVDAVIGHVASAGGRVLRQPSQAFWGGRTAYFADPEFNLWEVAWNPTAVFDERGAMVSF